MHTALTEYLWLLVLESTCRKIPYSTMICKNEFGQFCKHINSFERTSNKISMENRLHSDDIVTIITDDFRPSAWINLILIPIYKLIARSIKRSSQGIQSISWKTPTEMFILSNALKQVFSKHTKSCSKIIIFDQPLPKWCLPLLLPLLKLQNNK